MSILISFLERGILSPQMPTLIWLVEIYPAEVDTYISIWQHFIIYCVVHFPTGLRAKDKELGRAVEKFFEFAVDPHFWVSMVKTDSGQKCELQLTLGRDRVRP